MNASPSIVVAAVQQLFLALTFFIIPFVARRYGDQAQQSAEQSVRMQDIGTEEDFLVKQGVKFSESSMEMLLPLGIAILLTVIGILNLAGAEIGRTLTWIIEPLLIVIVGFVTAGQIFPVWYIKRAFNHAEDERTRSIDVEAFVQAAFDAFPAWIRPLQILRFGLATVGSVLVLVLLVIE